MSGCHEEISNVRDCQGDASFTYPGRTLMRGTASPINILKQKDATKKKPYYAKFLLPGEKQQRMLPGSSSSTAWEAAAKLAFHMAGFGGELAKKKGRLEARCVSKVCAAMLP